MKNNPLIQRACLIACLFPLIVAVGCGHTAALQKSTGAPAVQVSPQPKSPEPVAPQQPIKSDRRLEKCEKEVNSLIADNENLNTQITGLQIDLQACAAAATSKAPVVVVNSGKNKTKNSNNTDNSQVINLRRSQQILAQDNARLRADSTTQAGIINAQSKEITDLKQKNVGNTDSGNKSKSKEKHGANWWWILMLGYAGGKWGGLLIRRIWPAVDAIPVLKWLI